MVCHTKSVDPALHAWNERRALRRERAVQSFNNETNTYSLTVAGRACLIAWKRPLRIEDIVDLLQELKRAGRDEAGLVVILFMPQSVAPPLPNVREALRSVLPALLEPCREMLATIEGNTADRHLIRALFRAGGLKSCPRLCETLQQAIIRAQLIAPQDVLEIQRTAVYRNLVALGPRR